MQKKLVGMSGCAGQSQVLHKHFLNGVCTAKGAVPSDVSGDATCDMNQSKLLLILTGVLDLEPMLPVHVVLLVQQ